jgi:hypothetical protein
MSQLNWAYRLNVILNQKVLHRIIRDQASARVELDRVTRERDTFAARVESLAVQVRALEADRTKLAADNRRLAVDLDDALDRETLHALDADHELLFASLHCTPTGGTRLWRGKQ